jgi:hypothetical protein
MMCSLAEFIPAKELIGSSRKLDFKKCKKCGKPYQIYRIEGVCFDCHIEERLSKETDFKKALEEYAKWNVDGK